MHFEEFKNKGTTRANFPEYLQCLNRHNVMHVVLGHMFSPGAQKYLLLQRRHSHQGRNWVPRGPDPLLERKMEIVKEKNRERRKEEKIKNLPNILKTFSYYNLLLGFGRVFSCNFFC